MIARYIGVLRMLITETDIAIRRHNNDIELFTTNCPSCANLPVAVLAIYVRNVDTDPCKVAQERNIYIYIIIMWKLFFIHLIKLTYISKVKYPQEVTFHFTSHEWQFLNVSKLVMSVWNYSDMSIAAAIGIVWEADKDSFLDKYQLDVMTSHLTSQTPWCRMATTAILKV